MPGKRKIGAIIALDGEKEFRSAVTSCNKAVAAMRSEMKLVSAETAGSANTLETLSKKHDVLSRSLEASQAKEEAVRKGLEHAETQYARTGEELESYRKYLESAEKALKEMEGSADTTNDALEQQRKVVEDLTSIVSQGEETYKKAGDRVNDWKKQLNTAQAQTINATRVLNENDSLLKEAQSSYNGCAKSIDEFGNKTDNTAKKLTSFGTALKVNVYDALIDFGKNAVAGAVQGTLEMDDATRQLQASTGATAEEMQQYGGVMKDIYSAGYGDSVAEVADGMARVRQYTGEMDPTKLQEITENAMALSDTFGGDISENIRGVDALMTNMGLSAEEAFDYIVTGAQNGLDKSGELTDNLAEYSQLWGQAGFSAQEMFTILQNGLDSGAYNLDKVNDFVKEFSISLSDGRIEENLSSFSEETQNLFTAWQNGQATTRDVFYSVINDLSQMKNQQEALTIASNTWSALGEDNAMAVITSLDDVSDKYQDVKGAMESLKEVKYDSITNQYKKLGRTFQSEVITPILQKFLPVAQDGMELLAENIDKIIPVAGALGATMATVWVTNKAKDFIGTAKNAVTSVLTLTTATTAQATAAGSATVAQEGLNVAMSANPVGIVVTGITALVAGVSAFVALSPKTKTELDILKESADEAMESMEASQDALQQSMDTASESVDSAVAKGQMAEGIVGELTALADTTDKSNKKQERMAVLVAELNELYPDMELAIDQTTGALSMSNEELEAYVDNLQNAAMADAFKSAFEETYQGVTDATKELIDAEMEQEKVQKQLKTLNEDYETAIALTDAAIRNNGDGVIEWNGVMRDSEDVLIEINDQKRELEQKEKELSATIDEQTGIIEEGTATAEAYKEKQLEMTGAIQSSTAATQADTAAKGERDAAAQASMAVAGQELEAYRSLSESQQQIAVDVTNAVLTMEGNLQSSIETQLGLFETLDTGAATSMDSILEGLNSQIAGVQTWEQNLNTLIDWGINNDLLQTLIEAGPQTGSAVQAIVDAGSERIGELNETWNLKEQVMNVTNAAGEELKSNGAAKIAESFDGWSGTLKASGADGVMGLVDGMVAAQAEAEAAGEDLGVKTIDSINSGLGTHSPSWKTYLSGQDVDQGLEDGMESGKVGVSTMAESVGDTAINALKGVGMYWSAYVVGQDFGLGLQAGIVSVADSIAIEAAAAVRTAINAAKAEQNSNSPAKETMKLGGDWGEGYVVGIREKIPEAAAISADMVEATLQSVESKREYVRRSVAGALSFNAARQTIGALSMGMSVPQAGGAAGYTDIYSAVYSAIIAGLSEKNNAEYLKVIQKLADRPIRADFYIGPDKIAEATATQMTNAQQREMKLKNMLQGVKG